MDRARRIATVALCALTACSDELPPLGEAIVVVDTDLPVPRLASSLRLDLYTADGSRWYESREVAMPDARDWPASFSIYAPDEAERTALVRVRVFPRGKVRDYRGERFVATPIGADPSTVFPTPEPAPGETPRLERDGIDITPASEPQPLLTVDRLFLVRLEPGERGTILLPMRGVCVGAQADLGTRESCIDHEARLDPVVELPLDPELSRSVTSMAGTFGGDVPCTLTTGADEVCVPGAGYVFGNADLLHEGHAPERVVVVQPFRIDAHEVTVARWRAAVDAGFVTGDFSPIVNDATLDVSTPDGSPMQCSWSTMPRGREDFPLNCVSFAAARKFCQRDGGNLPSEAQWELVAQVAGRVAKTHQTWGNDQLACDRAVYARNPGATLGTGGDWCIAAGAGMQAAGSPGGDLSIGLGVADLEGNLAEIVLDGYQPLDAACWLAAPLQDPVCEVGLTELRTLRGSSWISAPWIVAAGFRFPFPGATAASFAGFRCVRGSDAP
jgi:formylglycine-generating enzyme required for sulfatase activity